MVRRPDPLPSWDELVAIAGEHGIDHLGVAPADVLDRARAALHERRAAGLAAGMGFTYRNPDRSTDPGRAVAGARSIIVAARSYLADRRARPTSRGPGPGRPLRLGRPLRPAADRAAGDRPPHPRAPTSGPSSFADDNSIVDREVAYLGRARLVRQERQPAPARRRELVRARLRRHDRRVPGRRTRSPTAAGRAGAASTAARPAPSSRPGVVDANRCLAWVAAAAGHDPRRAPRAPSATASTAATTARRCARRRVRLGGAPHDLPVSTAATSGPGVGRRARPARRRRRRRCSTATAAGTSPTATRGGCGATRSSCSATSATPATPASRRTLARYRADRGPDPRRARPLGERAELGLLATGCRREAPARHERLPAQDRRHPVAAVGVVAAAAARPLRRAHQPVRRVGRSSTPSRRSASSASASRCCCRTR